MNENQRDYIMNAFMEASPVLQALGDPVRQNIIIILSENSRLNVSEITALANVSRPAVSHHLKVLKNAGVVRMDRSGKQNVYYLHAKEALHQLKSLIEIVEMKCNR